MAVNEAISPLAQRGLYETLGLAVGLGAVVPGEPMRQAKIRRIRVGPTQRVD